MVDWRVCPQKEKKKKRDIHLFIRFVNPVFVGAPIAAPALCEGAYPTTATSTVLLALT